MASIKKRKNNKLLLPICIVLVIAIVAASATIVKHKNSGEVVSLNTIATDNIVESINATGEIGAGASREYKVATVATVKEVFVKVGDKVKQGDVLATFDTSDLDSQVAETQSTYETAKMAYNDSVKSQKDAEKKLKNVAAQIPIMEKKMARLKKATANTTTATTVKPTVPTTSQKMSATAATRNADPAGAGDDSASTSNSDTSLSFTFTTSGNRDPSTSLENISAALTSMMGTLSQLTDDVNTMNVLLSTIATTVSNEIATGNYSADAIAAASGDAIASAIRKGLVDETKLIIDSGVAVDMVENAVKAIDWAAIAKDIESTDTTQLTATEIQLAALYAEREILTLSADPSVVNAQKSLMNTSKRTLDVLKESQQTLSAGWTAAFDGIITECNIASGEQTNLATTGIKLENMDDMVVTISLGEYDVHKVKVGMPVTITTAYGKYDGEVASIAPTATGSSSSSIVDSVGSMAGVSELSSLTDSGAGVKCTVTVNNPDKNIIVGFTANVEVITGTYDDVMSVPIESIVLEKDGTFVYLYDEENNTVTKTPITTAATSDSAYQVTSGLKVGDKIVATPSTDYKEDTFKVKVVDKSVAKSASK